MEAQNLKKHLGLSEKSFITLSEREQAKIGGRLEELLHIVSDGAFVPLLNSCVEECHVRKLCALKGIVTTDVPSSFKTEDVIKEEPKDEPKEEPNDEFFDSDVDERMAEADADIKAGVWRSTWDTDHGNNKEESECAPMPQQYEQLETAKTEKSGGGVNGSSGGAEHNSGHHGAVGDLTCLDCGKIFKSKVETSSLSTKMNPNRSDK